MCLFRRALQALANEDDSERSMDGIRTSYETELEFELFCSVRIVVLEIINSIKLSYNHVLATFTYLMMRRSMIEFSL